MDVSACLQILSLYVFTKAHPGEHEGGAVCSEGHSLPGEMRRGENHRPDGELGGPGPVLVVFAAQTPRAMSGACRYSVNAR